MRRAAIVLAPALMLAGCGEAMTPAEKARRDARDVAFVETVQKQRAPVQPIALQPLSAADIRGLPSGEKACGLLLRDRVVDDPILVVGTVAGHVKLEGELVVLAADTGSEKLAPGIYRKYDGKAYALELSVGTTTDAGRRIGSMVIRESAGRVAFMAAGEWDCPAARAVPAP